MKKLFVIVVLTTVILEAGISIKTSYVSCDKKKQAKFVIDCITAGNPKSDEEPEDWIYECKNMSYSLFCNTKEQAYYWESRFFSPNVKCDCDKCQDEKAIEACKIGGYIK